MHGMRSFVFLTAVWCSSAWAWLGVVTHVSDGDTVWVQPLQGGDAYKVRLLGIDAPEICQLWGPQSRAALYAVLQGQVVDVQARTRDSYGRLLAQLTSQGNDVGGWWGGVMRGRTATKTTPVRMRRCKCRRKAST